MTPALILVLGYAIGTAQILLIDWWGRKREHDRQQRLLRAAVRQIHERSQNLFGWNQHSGPQMAKTPNPPRISTEYSVVVAATDFYLTDEHDDDNTQQGLFSIVDGIEVLAHYRQRVDEIHEKMGGETDPTRRTELRRQCVGLAEAYDDAANRLEFMGRTALDDLERRLAMTDFKTQAARALKRRLPKGTNPPLLGGTDDPRLSPPGEE